MLSAVVAVVAVVAIVAVVAVVAAIASAVEVPVVAIMTLQLHNSVGALVAGGNKTLQNHTSLVDQKTNLRGESPEDCLEQKGNGLQLLPCQHCPVEKP